MSVFSPDLRICDVFPIHCVVTNVVRMQYASTLFYRKHLEEALQMYEEKLGLKHPAVVDARSTLAYLCFKLGDWDRCKEYVEGTEDGLKASRESSDTVDLHVREQLQLCPTFNG